MLDLTALKKAVHSLELAVSKMQNSQFVSGLDEDTLAIFKAGVIQNFEFTYELCWKFMKRWLSQNIGTDFTEGLTRLELFRLAAENLLIENTEKWILFHKARNITSHTYNAETAEEIYSLSPAFALEARKLLLILERKND